MTNNRGSSETVHGKNGPNVGLSDLAYTDRTTIAGKYLRHYWHPVYQAEKLKPGQATEIRIMGENWTLYRSKHNQFALVGDRCAHRNAKLSIGWVEENEIRCFYHGWKYNKAGQCTDQPAENEPFCQKVRIRSAVAREYLGLVFAYFGLGEPPELPRYPEFENPDAHVQTFHSRHNFNYFNSIDNLLDAAHIGFVHSNHAGGYDGRTDKMCLQVSETCWGATSVHTREQSGKSGQTQFGMPNIFRVRMFPLTPDTPPREMIFWMVPIDDENYQRFFVEVVEMPKKQLDEFLIRRTELLKKQTKRAGDLAESVIEGKIRRDEVDQETTNYVNFVDDVAQLAQGRIHDRTSERLGSSDVGMKLVRDIWLRELTAFQTGQPLTPWRYDPKLPLIQADE